MLPMHSLDDTRQQGVEPGGRLNTRSCTCAPTFNHGFQYATDHVMRDNQCRQPVPHTARLGVAKGGCLLSRPRGCSRRCRLSPRRSHCSRSLTNVRFAGSNGCPESQMQVHSIFSQSSRRPITAGHGWLLGCLATDGVCACGWCEVAALCDSRRDVATGRPCAGRSHAVGQHTQLGNIAQDTSCV